MHLKLRVTHVNVLLQFCYSQYGSPLVGKTDMSSWVCDVELYWPAFGDNDLITDIYRNFGLAFIGRVHRCYCSRPHK